MKILLIIPPNIHYIEPYSYIKADKNNAIRPCLGLLYVAAAVRKVSGIEIRIIDCNIDNLDLAGLRQIIKNEQPDIVGFSVLTFNILNCIEVARIIRQISPLTKICFGGWHPTLYPQETLKLDCVDYIVIGEGEHSFSELVGHCMNKPQTEQYPVNIKGIGFKTSLGEIKINPPSGPIKNLDDLPLPAYDLIKTGKYSNLLARSEKVINLITSRGCPQRCIFCDIRGTLYRFRSPKNVLEEIKYWVNNGIREFFILDDNFTINRKRTIEFCKLLIESGLRVKYKISSRVDYLDDELLKYLKKSGCYLIYFGVESGVQKILDYFEKGTTIAQIKNVFKLCKKRGIDRFAYIMIGAPEETYKDIEMTLGLIKEIKPQHLHCSVCTPMPKTYFYQKLLAQGSIKHDYWREFADSPNPNFKTPFCSRFFSDKELRSIQNAIERDFYLNPRIIFQEIIKTRGVKQLVTKARLAFNVFSNN